MILNIHSVIKMKDVYKRQRLDFVLNGALVIVGVRIISFVLGRTYSGIVRFTGTEDALRIYYVLTAGEIALLVGDGIYFLLFGETYIPLSVLLTERCV